MQTAADVPLPVTRAVSAFKDPDPAGFVAEFAADGTVIDPVQDQPLARDELRAYLEGVLAAFPDVRTEEHRIVTTAETAAVEATFHATHEGAFDGIPPTGATIAVPMVSMITASDDGITSWRDY